MTFFTEVQTLTLVLLLVCAVCIAPVMATTQTEVVEDGVHLVKFDTSPTKLDPAYYRMDVATDFVVDGDQYYWVRIGSVAAKGLSSNAVAQLVCKYGLYLGALGAGGIVGAVASGAEVGSLGTATPIVLPAAGFATGFIIGIAGFSDEVCQKFETWFVNNKYQVVASDGTILTGVAKNNNAGIQELKKDGIDIEKLTHLSKEGRVLLTCPHGQMLTCDSAAATCHCG